MMTYRFRIVYVHFPCNSDCFHSSAIQVVLSRHNLPRATQVKLVRGEFPERMCIEQGVMLSSRFAEWKVLWISRVLWMAGLGLSQSSV